MKVALDTNAYSDWKRGVLWSGIISTAAEVHISTIVLGELRYGFACGNTDLKNNRELEAFLKDPVVMLDLVSAETTYHYAQLKKFLRQVGKLIPENDIWIAASCLEHGSTLLTSDRHFEELPQVSVLWPAQ